MARKPSNYWEIRSTKLMQDIELGTQYTINDLIKIYEQATKNINKEIENVFKNYAKDTNLNKEALTSLLNKKETKKHYENLLKVINSDIVSDEVKQKLLTKYNAPAYSYRISRLQAIQDNIDVELNKLAELEQQITKARYVKTIDEAYHRNIYNIQSNIGMGFSFSNLDMKTVNLLLASRWVDNKNFSQRIWGNIDKLNRYLKINFTANMLTGKSVNKISKELSEYMNVGMYNATTLVRTEVNHFANEATALSYEECEVEKYEFIATLDSRTCDKCGTLDNQKFNLKDKSTGVNYPPMHPNDRCTTVPYIEDEIVEGLQRRAKDANGKSILVPANMSYQEWKKHYKVDVLATTPNTKLQNTQNYDKITVDNLLTKLNITIEDYVPFGKYDPFDNDIQEQAAELLGMDKLPKVNKKEYSNSEGTPIVRVLHSYQGTTADEAYKNTIKGRIKYSENTNSSFGRGIYFGSKSIENNIVASYSGRSEDIRMINAKIHQEANILEFKNQMEYIKDVSRRISKVPENLRRVYQKETSLLYMLEGIDGIKIESNQYYCVYNRGVLIIDEQ